jgi:hypothetical protein
MTRVETPVLEPRLLDVPVSGIYPVSLRDANTLLEHWNHRLGPVNRPFRSEPWVLEAHGLPVAVAVSCSIVHGPVAGYMLHEVVELARLAGKPPFTRPMLRLWREICAPAWQGWTVRAAVSYSHNAMHSGDLYRFDGWEKIRDDAGSGGGGAWSRRRHAGDAVAGRKSLWIWRYDR